jgi:very-short-patch-repair endonuclease
VAQGVEKHKKMQDTVCEIDAVVAAKVTFATQQASVPVLVDLVVRNTGAEAQRDLILRLTCDPPVLGARDWRFDQIAPGGEIRVRDRLVKLDGGMLSRLNEAMRAQLTLTLTQAGSDEDPPLAEWSQVIEALARNEWGGAGSMPELLASFIMPNDPAVATVLREASEIMRTSGKEGKFEGYQSKSRKRVWEMASAIWSAVAARRLTYVEPPASFERVGQKIRSPSDVLSQGLATCLDTAVLFAAALEQAGLHPVLGLVEGHVLAGVWLQPTQFGNLTTEDPVDVRKHLDSKELVLFETTLVTASTPASFSQAVDSARRQMDERNEDRFVCALDVRQARGRLIKPLAIELPASSAQEDNIAPLLALGLEEAPELPGFDLGVGDDPVLDTPESRIDHWKRKLLDLTKRNRLLNLKASKAVIPMVCTDPAKLEDMLADGGKVQIISIPPMTGEADGRDDELFEAQTRSGYERNFAHEALERNELATNVEPSKLDAGLIELFRKANSDMQEGGANTLFLAIGLLRWRPSGTDGQSYRAPLLLVPVKLQRKSAVSKMELSLHEDEPSFNLTLLEMLRQDFEIRVPELETGLPPDGSDIDVQALWNIMRRAVRDVPGFEVVEEVVLSTFSFAKYLMWKDLSDRTEQLKASPLVRHLIDHPRQSYEASARFLTPEELDDQVEPSSLYMPLTADSSQIVAVHASGGEGDFVLEGPPGTGKSQTIANIIAHNLGLGRRVLFVAEKMVALNVVYDRLRRVGLGDFCLELHSNKANKREVLDQLDKSWRGRTVKSTAEWSVETQRLKETRDKLNTVVRELHRPGPTGLSPRDAVSLASGLELDRPILLGWGSSISDDRATDSDGRKALQDLSHRLGQAFADLDDEDIRDFGTISQAEWSNQWSGEIANAARALLKEAPAVQAAARAFSGRTGLPDPGDDPQQIRSLAAAAKCLLSSQPSQAFALLPDGRELLDQLSRASAELVAYRDAQAQLSIEWPDDAIKAVDVEALGRANSAATSAFWPIGPIRGWLLQGKMVRLHSLPGRPDIGADLPTLEGLKAHLAAMDQETAALPREAGWRGLASVPETIGEQLRGAAALRASIGGLSQNPAEVAHLRETLRLIVADRDLTEPGGPIHMVATELVTAADRCQEAVDRFCELAGVTSGSRLRLGELADIAVAVIERQPRLNAWCRWQGLSQEAHSRGIGALVEALLSGVIEPTAAGRAFDAAYARWLAPVLVDSRPVLRDFSPREHNDLVNRFRLLDEKVASLSAQHIRATLSQGLPDPADPNRHSGFGTLKHEIQKQKRHKPVRQLVSEMGDALTRLTPCLLMSPLSVAQFLDANSSQFDLVIFDEASQITVWDAIGSIARGRNAIIVGDPKQMPPTSFFDRAASDDSEDGDGADDLESILDEAMAASVKHHRLTGHYRSRHESLIAFSNHRYYGGDLVTFPCPETRDTAVTFIRCDGVWQRGGRERTNPVEAKAVVREVVRRLNDPELSKLSIGVVTLNADQQRLVLNLLDEERRAKPSLERFFNEEGEGASVFVKNLETVQGDERDVIMLSIGYGPSEPGARAMAMNFGPLNRKGGGRRLNVAITRATTEMVVFASFDADMVDLARTQAEAVRDLKHFLDFARRGPIALGEAVKSAVTTDGYDSPFEEAIARGLRSRGWIIHTQIGISRFRIDLGIVHPDAPGRYLAGVECDGASYHASPTARDRDKVRQAVLEGLGWSLLRIWSTDYFNEPNRVMAQVHAKLNDLLDADRAGLPIPIVGQDTPDAPVVDPIVEGFEAIATSDTQLVEAAASEVPGAVALELPVPEPAFVSSVQSRISPERFGDADYAPVLRTLCNELIDHFGPITFKHLAEKAARAHGFLRTGSQIKKSVWAAAARERKHSREGDHSPVFWPTSVPVAEVFPFRGLTVAGEARPWADVPMPERRALAREISAQTWLNDPPGAMAERIGFERLRETTRAELVELLKEVSR